MTVRIEKQENIWTIIHSRPEARNAMDPKSADELYEAFIEFDNNKDASVAVFWGEGGERCFCSSFLGRRRSILRRMGFKVCFITRRHNTTGFFGYT